MSTSSRRSSVSSSYTDSTSSYEPRRYNSRKSSGSSTWKSKTTRTSRSTRTGESRSSSRSGSTSTRSTAGSDSDSMIIEAVSSVCSRGRHDSQGSLCKATVQEPDFKSPPSQHLDPNYAKSKSEFGESILFEEVSVGSPGPPVGSSPQISKQPYAQSTATFGESLIFEEVSASPKHDIVSPTLQHKSTDGIDLIPQESILFEEVPDPLGDTAPVIDTSPPQPQLQPTKEPTKERSEPPAEESDLPANDAINGGRHKDIESDNVGESPPDRKERRVVKEENKIPQRESPRTDPVKIANGKMEQRVPSRSPPKSRSPQEGVIHSESYTHGVRNRKITRQSSLHNELYENGLKRAENKESPRPSWQNQLRGGSTKGRISRHGSAPAWQVVNQPATSPQKRDKGGAYHGCSFGAPPQPAPSAVVTPREKGGYQNLRGIDNKRRELLLECNRCTKPGHQTKDCDRNRRESNFDPSGGATMQKNFTGTFPPLPPVQERAPRKVADPQLANVSSRFRDWESRSATPPVQRSRTPTKVPQPWKVASGRPESAASPRKKEDVIKKLQSENKKLQRAIEQMKNKMVHLEEMNSQNSKSIHRDVTLERTVPLPNTARPSAATPPSHHSSPSGPSVQDSYLFTHAPRSTSLPRKTTSPHDIYFTGRKSRTPQRVRGSAQAQVDWRSRYTLSTSEERRAASNSAQSAASPLDYHDHTTPDRRRAMRRTTSLNTHERISISDVMPTEAVVSAALAPTLEARIQSLEAIQKDVRAALGKDGYNIPKNIGKRKQELDYPHEIRTPDPAKPHYIKQQHWRRSDRAAPNKTKERVAMMNVLKPRWM
eukprot:TRINITY_DN33720_c0_g1_i1.p1 TRINITY_DN33720_c0_g1~~TRINITY_DN33720_c0_g1_i1.p1  ORF type:complete len:828 (+),score=129.39 TRINITY_DN33720_c0_g1_i1:154-2637(+)